MSSESTADQKYKAIARIGSGGMADIYLTEVAGPSGFRKLAVVKRLRTEDIDDDEMVRMFMDEARIAARLNHPNIVNTFEVGTDQAGDFIAMEYLEGQPLDRILRRPDARAEFSLPLQLSILAQVLGALQYAHDLRDYDQTPLGIVHRDVSPNNVFVLYSGQSKLVDFGIAKSANALGRTRAGAIKGKFAYMAPEQARSEDVDPRTDVFSVGLILWEALAGRRVWAGLNESQILHALLSTEPLPSPSEFARDVPLALERVCMQAISLSPDGRFGTAGDFQTALEDAMNALAMRVSSRDIGRALEHVFASDRARIRDEVDAFTRAAPGEHELLPVLAFDVAPAAETARLTNASFSNSRASVAPPPKRSRASWVVGGAVALAAAVVAVVAFVSRPPATPSVSPFQASPQATASTPPLTRPEAPPSAAPAPEVREVRVVLSAVPASAEIFLDNVPVPNPFRTHRAADGSEHVVRITDRGHVAQTRRIELKEDVLLDVALSPLPVYVQPPRPKGKPASPPAAAAAPASPSPLPPAQATPPPPADTSPRAPALDDPLAPPPTKKPRGNLDLAPW